MRECEAEGKYNAKSPVAAKLSRIHWWRHLVRGASQARRTRGVSFDFRSRLASRTGPPAWRAGRREDPGSPRNDGRGGSFVTGQTPQPRPIVSAAVRKVLPASTRRDP